MDTIYNQIYVPISIYACGSWGWAVRKVHIRRKLIAAERRALMHITRVYKTTPNISLHILARKAPINHLIDYNTKLWHLKWGKATCINNQIIDSQDLECNIQYALTKHPATPNKINFYQPDHVDIEIFTDGSKANFSVGSAFVAFHNNEEIASGQHRLGDHCSVLQAEMFAIRSAVAWSVSNFAGKSVAIISDSASSISLIKNHSCHPISTDIQDTINNSCNLFFIYWTRAHQGTLGNERADALAKSASDDSNLPVAYNKINSNTVKNLLWKDLLVTWQQEWDNHNHPVTHRFIPNIESFLLNKWYIPGHRNSQFLTGHGRFQSYLARFVNAPSSNCSLCGTSDSNLHYIFDCPMLELERHYLKSTIEAHGYSWPRDCYSFFNHQDSYLAFLMLINNYFGRTTVTAYI
ncbi:uncharacterized protein LOC111627026 [Centruroides sculpturatus]|uniref:uncharacterized protein LOC111627026 n=1 Tax=Centruroides sculpturatus TaxID=218467 RepID=UPI000C6D0EB5|nr:uncharacterized protein LOC111627026 [Centruroides sculpturatus]